MESMKSACGSLQHFSRRSLLQGAGAAGLSWLTPLSQQLALGVELGTQRRQSVIVLWLQGGASQLETFDPHPDSPVAFGSRAIRTSANGIQIADSLPLTADVMSDLSVVRSVVSEEGDHARATYNIKTGYRPFPGITHPSLGAIICHETQPLDGQSGRIDIPTHISILSGRFAGRGGYLGAHYDAFKIGDPVKPIPDVRARVPEERQDRRLDALSLLETSFAAGRMTNLEAERTLHQASLARASNMMTSDQLAAFDVSAAPVAEQGSYGDTPFGRSCLAALRLVEAGVTCVEVTLNGWDTHINNHESQAGRNAILDPALASLVTGLKERGLYDDTVILVGTEFGRTPKLNLTEGRDHWPHGFSVLLGGGGLRGGIAVGQTDPSGEKEQPDRPVQVADIHSTVMSTLGVDPTYELTTPIGRPLPLSEGNVIGELL